MNGLLERGGRLGAGEGLVAWSQAQEDCSRNSWQGLCSCPCHSSTQTNGAATCLKHCSLLGQGEETARGGRKELLKLNAPFWKRHSSPLLASHCPARIDNEGLQGQSYYVLVGVQGVLRCARKNVATRWQ